MDRTSSLPLPTPHHQTLCSRLPSPAGLLSFLTRAMLLSATGPLHTFFPLIEMLFHPFSAWLTSFILQVPARGSPQSSLPWLLHPRQLVLKAAGHSSTTRGNSQHRALFCTSVMPTVTSPRPKHNAGLTAQQEYAQWMNLKGFPFVRWFWDTH